MLDAEALRAAIGDTFAKRPTLHWATALSEIADKTEVDVEGTP
jgi:hypothetical protein